MARPQSVDAEDLLTRLAEVFAAVGYEGASLARLAQAAGLQKASLYHRFPGGKAEMAARVLARAAARLEAEVLAPIRAGGPLKARMAAAVAALDRYYDGGRRACLFNMLAAPDLGGGPFGPAIRDAFAALVDGFAVLAGAAGNGTRKARRKAERAVMLVQGSLVLARGTGDPAPFRAVLERLPDELA
jgi:AcrR family transcriptional regulator